MAKSTIQSLVRGLHVLREVARSEEGVTAMEIAEKLGITRPTAHNLLVTLLEERYLTKWERPTRYRLGSSLDELVELASQSKRRLKAKQIIEDLLKKHPDVGFVYSEAGSDEMRVLWRVDYRRTDVIEEVFREVIHPYATALALTFHAFAGEDRSAALRNRYRFEDFARPTWQSRDEFNAFLDKVRSTGYVSRTWEDERQEHAMAAPIFNQGESLVGAIGAFSPFSNKGLDKTALLESIRQAARDLSGNN